MDHKTIKNRDILSKEINKFHHDRRNHAKESDINIGDQVILKQRKSSTKPPYDPEPYAVTDRKGCMITAYRNSDQRQVTRDASKWRKVKFMSGREKNVRKELDQFQLVGDELDINLFPGNSEVACGEEQLQMNPIEDVSYELSSSQETRRYPTRNRRPTKFYVPQ